MKKVIIVTGGARGIGKEIVKMLAKQEEYHVIMNYCHSEVQAKQIQENLKKQGYAIDIFKADVSKRQEVHQLVQYALQLYNKIDILINNAGISQCKLFTEITDEDWNIMINTNLTSVFYTTQEVLKSMIHEKNGCIINISSIWGSIGGSCEVHYSATKGGIDAMTKALAKEVGPCNIRVNSIAPGAIYTQMNQELNIEDWEEIKNQTPLRKIGKPEDIAKCIKWLIEDEFTTGAVIAINGGWLIA